MNGSGPAIAGPLFLFMCGFFSGVVGVAFLQGVFAKNVVNVVVICW
jgi:hypothetical protein